MQGRERGHVLSGVMNSLGYVIAKETDEWTESYMTLGMSQLNESSGGNEVT
jgi:hypothetical protein